MDARRTSSCRPGRPPAFGAAGHRSDIHQQRTALRSGSGDAAALFRSRCGQIARSQLKRQPRNDRERARAIRVKIPDTTERSRIHTLMLRMAVGSFAIGVIVRVFAAHNDLWFDEVWSLELLRERVHSFDDVFTNVK